MNPEIDLRQERIGQRSLGEWDTRWEPLPRPFIESHPDLRHVVGLFRAVLDGETKYIACATERPGGISKALRRVGGPDQTGNRGYGAQMIRQHITEVTVEILRVDDKDHPEDITKKLKRMMVKLYDPEWARPFNRRMEAIRLGNIPT